MPNWNPSAPDTLGLQWLVASDGAYVIDNDAAVAGVQMPSTKAEMLDAVWVYLPSVTRHSTFSLEVFDAGSEIPTDRQVTQFLPSADKHKENVETDTGSTINLFAKLAKLDLPEDIDTLVNFIRRKVTPTRKQRYTCNFATGTALAGRRITDVRVVLSGNSDIGQISETLLYDGFNFISLGKGQLRPSEFNRKVSRLSFAMGQINPYSRFPWRVSDVQSFASSASAGLDFKAIKDARCHQIFLEVEHVAENRRAIGQVSVSEPGWVRFDMITVDRLANWTKPLGTHTYVLRRIKGKGAASWAYLDSESPSPLGAVSYRGESRNDGTIKDLGKQRTGVPAVVLEGTYGGPYSSEDSQPYADHRIALVYTGRSASQRFTPVVGGNYGLVTVLVRLSSPEVVSALTVRVVRVSDSVVIGGSASLLPVAAADLPEVGKDWRQWKVALSSPAALVANIGYRLELTSSATGAKVGGGTDAWEVGYLDTLGQATDRSYGSTTQFATVEGADDLDADLPITIATVPDPPPPPPPPPAPEPPTPALTARVILFEDRLQAAHLAWMSTSLGTRFARYEIERSNPNQDWQRIAEPTTEALDFFDDFEGGWGITSSYRIRVMRDDGAVSAWTTPASATPIAVAGRWGLVSNEFPPLSKTYHCQEPNSFKILDNQTILELYGRDGAVSFRGLEDRLDEFTLEIWVESDQVGRAVFEELKTLIRSRLSYVCVLDPDGWRWFGALSLGDAVQEWKDGFCFIPVTVRELTRTSSVTDP